MRHSLYWDDFERRIDETVMCLRNGTAPPVRRVAVFITDRCNFRCAYCNVKQNASTMEEATFDRIVQKYGDSAIIHITGGEPSVVSWLYPYLREHGKNYRFHLNTNAFVMPPAEHVRRLKVSLDNCHADEWNKLVGVKAFDRVVGNIQEAIPNTVVSITYTLTHANFERAPEFADFAAEAFPGLYALFFSVYKGTDERFAFTTNDVETFFYNVLPQLKQRLAPESLALLEETLDEKRRLIEGIRFPQNQCGMCYISMSERVFDSHGNECLCSHLYRDGILLAEPVKHEKCLYGCNRRLVAFNEEVEKRHESA